MTTQRLTMDRPSPFRRRRFLAPHRRRSLTLRLLKPFLLAVLLVGLPVAAGIWVATSPQFRLSQVQVGGTDRVTMDQVTTALAPLQGRHLLNLSLEEIEQRLTSNPWIEGAAIRKELPNRLVVEVHERQPAALLRLDGDLYYVDRGGFVIGPYDLAGPVDLLLLSTTPGVRLEVEPALEVAAAVDRDYPELGAALSEIELLGQGDFRIESAALPFPILVRGEQLEQQLLKLEMVLPEILHRYEGVTAVDLRFTRQIVIQPAEQPRIQEG